ncbi:hypothetical protein [Paenibacillus sp. FSL P2-0121]|uniref:hypothetical protein n=1 Tax=unclassified Paenibacillus TaxID=185978 RepID=UPI0030CACFB8
MSQKNQMSQSVIDAYLLLNRMRDNAIKYDKGSYKLERIEQALDYLLQKPEKEGDPKVIVRDLMGSAGKKIRGRINLLKEKAELAGLDTPIKLKVSVDNSFDHKKFELMDELYNSQLNKSEKSIIKDLYFDYNTEEMAARDNVPIGTMRTRVSRARFKYVAVLKLAI